MRPELEEVKLLEEYVQERLTEDQQQNTSIRLLWDKVWQHKLIAQKTAYKALRLAGRQQLRSELESIHSRLFG
ncbi:hypothetical protein [Xanthocytophaga agilis]|uniref:Uncharacterized protein n=1 Tax=Xanthocytophaga agilis TaxID=3048010 RepID=A0AAE3UDX5_9BACT|nr:hypothetical protein [Xanthocytophaga agilis]MDJ1501660.1 hypothetical protein [Xanthocytophaga agilis]